jgi:hypothetical protein
MKNATQEPRARLSHSKLLTFSIALLIAITLGIASILWVPVNPKLIMTTQGYFDANLMEETQPRALPGTIAQLISLTPLGFIAMLQLLKFAWLFLLAYSFLSKTPNYSQKNIFNAAVLTLPFAFSHLVYVSNAASGFLDIAYSLPILAAAMIVVRSSKLEFVHVLGIALLVLISLMIHEKSFAEILILFGFIFWKFGIKKTLQEILMPSLLYAGVYLFLVFDSVNYGLSPRGYLTLNFFEQPFQVFYKESLHFTGIIIGGGAFWALYVYCSRQFLRKNRNEKKQHYYGRHVLDSFMFLCCLVMLFFGHDTARMVSIVWLPCFLYMMHLNIPKRINDFPKERWLVSAICASQLLVPPLFIFNKGATPVNCYGNRVLSHISSPFRGGLFDFQRYYHRPDIEYQTDCRPIHILRFPAPDGHKLWN